MYDVLVTCPPMLGQLDAFINPARDYGLNLVAAETTQILSEDELISLLSGYHGWIIGDDPATRRVFEAGVAGKLKAAVKWGIGVDNVDFDACQDLGIPIANTPNMFGGEVADLAMALILGLARKTHYIDRGVRRGEWPKPACMSVSGKRVGVVGFGDIGKSLVKRLGGFDVAVTVYDPGVEGSMGFDYVERKPYPEGLQSCDFLVLTCSLTPENIHMVNEQTLTMMKSGSYVVNVARGPLVDEQALINSLRSGHTAGVALDVFEIEPPSRESPLLDMDQCILGSHNGSNTSEAVTRATMQALKEMANFLYGR